MKLKTKKNKTERKKEQRGTYHRSHPLKNYLNASKLKKVQEVYQFFRPLETSIAQDQWRLLQEGNLDFSINRNDLPFSPLNQRYLREAEYNAVSTLKSFLANLTNKFRGLVLNSELDEETKHQLLTINSWHAWYYRPIMPNSSG